MKWKETLLLDLLRGPLKFIPHDDHPAYESCANSPTDVLGFINWQCIGHVVYYGDDHISHEYFQQLPLISGGQLLTSIILFIAALAKAIEESEDFDGVTSKQLRERYLFNESEKGLLRYKFLPLDQADRESMIWLLENGASCSKVTSLDIRQDFERYLGNLRQSKMNLAFHYNRLLGHTVFDVNLNRRGDEVEIENLIAVGHELGVHFKKPLCCGPWEKRNICHGK